MYNLKIIISTKNYSSFVNHLEDFLIFNDTLVQSIIINGVQGFEEPSNDILELTFNKWEITFVLPNNNNINQVKQIIVESAKTFNIDLLNIIEEIDNTNYVLKNNTSQTIILKNLIVFNKQQNFNKYKGKKIPLLIEQSTAFGTGKHETTFMCLKFIENLTKLTNINNINLALDIGTGSGILAIALAKLFTNSQILACDIDSLALNKANDFFKINNTNIKSVLSTGFDKINQKNNDIIFANILLEPLILMENDFYNHLKPNGFLVLSGFLNEQYPLLLNKYKQNFKVIKKQLKNNWVAVLLQKQ